MRGWHIRNPLCAGRAFGGTDGVFNEYSQYIGEFLTWISNPDTTVPIARLLQGVAAIVGALITALGFWKAWRYAESRLGKRLSEFIEQEQTNVVLARTTVRKFRGERSAVMPNRLKIFTNRELGRALRLVRGRRLTGAETALIDCLSRTKEREQLAREKTCLHEKQRAMAHLLLGSIEDSRGDHRAALANFQSALEIDPHDVEAMEYVGLQLLKLGDPKQAAAQFLKLADVAEKRGDKLLFAHAYRNLGLACEAQDSDHNANIAYVKAINAFPQNGPPLDIAYIHELRGRANLRLERAGPAQQSLTSALTRYSQLEIARIKDSKEAEKGVQRIHEALAELEKLQNGTTASDTGSDTLT